MGTRSIIIAKHSDGRFGAIYCHWDGYLSHNGRILFEHYQDQSKIDQLLELGDLSSLGEDIGKKHNFDWSRGASYGTPEYEALQAKFGRMCNAYGRDRGETDIKARWGETPESVLTDMGQEYIYVWNGSFWLWTDQSMLSTAQELTAAQVRPDPEDADDVAA